MSMTTTIDPKETAEAFRKAREQSGMDEPTAIGNVADAVVKFKQVEDFTTFLAEYTLLGDDIVIHFFPPREAYVLSNLTQEPAVPAEYLRYWKRKFPEVLSPVAERVFMATAPIITAMYIEEMTSWWMRANGYATRLEPDELIRLFFVELDRSLDAA